MNKKLFLVFIFGLFLISNISAFEFDNIKEYDNTKNIITITNAFGLGDNIAEVKLDTPLVYNVIRGEDRLVAEFTINNFDDYIDVFNDMEFYNINDNLKEFDREFTYKYKNITGIKEHLVYNTICDKLEPGQRVITGCVQNLIINESVDVFE